MSRQEARSQSALDRATDHRVTDHRTTSNRSTDAGSADGPRVAHGRASEAGFLREAGPEGLRQVFRRHAATVAVVTASYQGSPVGLLVTSLASVSADPPLISFNVARSSSSWPALRVVQHIGVHVLDADQQDLAARFARKGADRFSAPTSWQPGPHGTPVLNGVAARAVALIEQRVEAGDHVIVIARLRYADAREDSDPLLHHDGQYRRVRTIPTSGSVPSSSGSRLTVIRTLEASSVPAPGETVLAVSAPGETVLAVTVSGETAGGGTSPAGAGSAGTVSTDAGSEDAGVESAGSAGAGSEVTGSGVTGSGVTGSGATVPEATVLETANANPRYASAVDLERYGTYRINRDPADPRPLYRFAGRLVAPRSARPDTRFVAEPGRFHLYSGWFCPWAQRSTLVIALAGLEDVVSVSYVDDVRDARGWAFREANGPDPVNGFRLLREAYDATEPGFDGHVSVPTLWDRQIHRVASNDYGTLDVDLASEFQESSRTGVDLYPVDLRPEIDELERWLHPAVNRGVSRAAGVGDDARAARDGVQAAFAELDRTFAESRYLLGDRLTLADVRLFVTLVRYDLQANAAGRIGPRLPELPNLWAYARDLFQQDAFRATTRFASFVTRPTERPGNDRSGNDGSGIDRSSNDRSSNDGSGIDQAGVGRASVGQPSVGQPSVGQPSVDQPDVDQPDVDQRSTDLFNWDEPVLRSVRDSDLRTS